MAIGQGKYDDECTKLREEAEAAVAVVIVVAGNRGSGFSLQVDIDQTQYLKILPEVLRDTAAQIERDMGLGDTPIN